SCLRRELDAQWKEQRARRKQLRGELAAERLRDLRPLRRDVLELEGIVVERVEVVALLVAQQPPAAGRERPPRRAPLEDRHHREERPLLEAVGEDVAAARLREERLRVEA